MARAALLSQLQQTCLPRARQSFSGKVDMIQLSLGDSAGPSLEICSLLTAPLTKVVPLRGHKASPGVWKAGDKHWQCQTGLGWL